ncbi:MAG: B12-binding domain-containing radical SAM protein [Candidatus Rokubacteria bacterium]|nr:B12-binding domain-containing radical SAM protein [Candidatus Rokubacteria bacterium]
MSNIVLIRPPMVLSKYSLSTSITPSIAIAYLSGTLRENGYEPQTIDALGEDVDRLTPIPETVGLAQGLSIDEIVDRIDGNAEIIGFSSMFSCAWTYDRKIIHRIRQRFPKALIIAGGEHITACPDYVLQDCPALDLCVSGEGEETLLDIVNTYFAGKDPRALNGVAFQKDGSVQLNPSRARIRGIDNVPEPYWDDLPLEVYMSRGLGHGVDLGRSMPLLATRGCPFQCTFCSSPFMWTTRWEARSPEKVLEEMKKYIRKYRAENFDLYDLTAIVKKRWIMDFCDLIIKSGLKFTWQLPSGTRSEAIDAEVVDKLWESGCRNMNYAPESGSPTVLKRIKKYVKLPRLEASMKAAIQRGLNVKINMIFAFPEDTPYEMWEDYKFGIRCALIGVDDSSFIPYVPYPGSELYHQLARENKIEPMSDDYFNSLIPFSDLKYAKSYNPHLKDRHLVWARCLYFALFYGTMFLRRPWRLARILMNLFRGRQESRGEATLRHLFLRNKLLRQLIPH